MLAESGTSGKGTSACAYARTLRVAPYHADGRLSYGLLAARISAASPPRQKFSLAIEFFGQAMGVSLGTSDPSSVPSSVMLRRFPGPPHCTTIVCHFPSCTVFIAPSSSTMRDVALVAASGSLASPKLCSNRLRYLENSAIPLFLT